MSLNNMDINAQLLDLTQKYTDLKKAFDDFQAEYSRNNFSARQDFNKASNFTTRLKVPHYATLPSTCDVGEIVEVGGKLYVASAINTWVVAGTQS